MDDIERRLRAAMASVTEPVPPGLMEGIRRKHRRHIVRLASGCLAVLVAIGFTLPGLAHALQGSPSPAGPAPTRPAPLPAKAAPGTVLLTCESANWGGLGSSWRAGSLHVGPLWLVGGSQQGWVHQNGAAGVGHVGRGHAKLGGGVMIVEVANGSAVVMKVTPQARSYFRFLDGFGPDVGYVQPAGDWGYTFIACPRGEGGPNGQLTDFYLGFSGRSGSRAAVDVWTSPSSARPVQIIFTPLPHTGGFRLGHPS
jgi:hypothetical protein